MLKPNKISLWYQKYLSEVVGMLLGVIVIPFYFFYLAIEKIFDFMIDHGLTILGILFWFFLWFAGIWYVSNRIIDPVYSFSISVHKGWILWVIFIIYFYVFGKFARSRWREHYAWWLSIKLRMKMEIEKELSKSDRNSDDRVE